jgi:serine/threonine protein kinase
MRGEKKYIYILSEALSKTGYQFLSVSKNITHGSVILYSQLVERLQELYKKYNFNHGDLKPGNVMFDSQNNLRLIDFGLSRLVLNKDDMSTKIIIDTTTQFTANSSEHRDLTLMAALIRYNFKLMIKDFVDDIETGYGCLLSRAMNGDRAYCNGQNVSDIGDVYIHINNYKNKNGTFESVLKKITPLIEGLDEKAKTLATIYKENPDPSQLLPGQPSQPPKTLAAALEGGGGGGGGGGEVIEADTPPTSIEWSSLDPTNFDPITPVTPVTPIGLSEAGTPLTPGIWSPQNFKPLKLPNYQGGAKVKRKTKSKRIYRNYGKLSSYRKSKRVTKRRHSCSLG